MTTGVPERLETVYLPVQELVPYHRNAHHGNVHRIRGSLREHSQFKPIVVNLGNHTGRPNEVLCGSHTLLAAREEGWPELAAVVVDVGDEQAAKINLVDNPRPNHPEDLDYDDRLLLELLTDLPDLDGTGYDTGDLDVLTSLLDPPAHGGNDQDVLDATDRAGWPVIRAQVDPVVHQRWLTVEGADDAARVLGLLEKAGY